MKRMLDGEAGVAPEIVGVPFPLASPTGGPLALDLLPKLEEEARERKAEHGGTAPGKPAENTSSDSGRSDEKAAALVGIGRSTRWGALPLGEEPDAA